MRKVIIVLLLGLFFCSACSTQKTVKKEPGEKVLRVGVTAQYKPWCYTEKDQVVGIDPQVLAEAARRMGNYKVEYTVASFDGMFGLLDAGKVDTVAQQITINEVRKEKYQFSEIYAYNPYRLCVREDNQTIKSLEDLKGKSVVCRPQGQQYDFMMAYKKEHDPNDEIKIVMAENSQNEMVATGKVDACTHAVAIFDQMVEESGFSLKLVGDIAYNEENAFPFRKDADPELVKKFNEAIRSMKEDGFLSDLYKKELGVDLLSEDIQKR